ALVARAPPGPDRAAGLAELDAETAHVDVHGARLAEIVVAPHLAQQLFARQHAALVMDQESEQVELAACERELASAHRGFTAQRVERQFAGAHLSRGRG